MNNGSVNKKRLVIRLVLLALLVVLCFLLYYYGKQHEILLDNKTAEIGGQTYEAAELVRITINGDASKPTVLNAKERTLVKVTGPRHTIKVEIVDKVADRVIKTEERVFNFGKTSSLMISIPAVAEKVQDVYLPLPGTMVQAPAPAPETSPATETTETEGAPGAEMEAPSLSD